MIKVLIFLISSLILNNVNAESNRLIRVDGISPTCMPRERCRSFSVVGSVISVDKSLPYMGSNYCCLTFEISNEEVFNGNGHYPSFLAHLSNTSSLEGEDYISIFEGDEKSDNLIKNITVNDLNPYETVFLKSSLITVEFYKDRGYRSTFEIVIAAYHDGTSPLCKQDTYFRCGSNTSICIDEELTCDKFPHCPNEYDEDSQCGANNDSSLHYDKLTIMIVLGSFLGLVAILMFSIFLLCFFRTKSKLTNTFLSIFGQPMDLDESELYYCEELGDEHQDFINTNTITKSKPFKKSYRSMRK